MKATSIDFENFRNIAAASLSFSPGVNVLWGQNAQGKSNILEGIYYFARGKSFRGVPDRLIIRTDAEFASVTLRCRGGSDRYDTELQAILPRAGRKKLTRAGAPLSGVREMVGSFRAVLFCPEHLSLVSGAPAERRAFLDIALAQLYPRYVAALSTYTHALTERNSLLRQAAQGLYVEGRQWDVYAEQLARSGAAVACARASYTAQLCGHVKSCFADMTGGREDPALRYVSLAAEAAESGEAAAAQVIYDAMRAELPREIAAGTTLHGVHRDDVEITLNGGAAKLYASQGQTRSLALAMKLGEGALSRSVGGEEPVYLLDDVFSELDSERRGYLLSALGERQVIITSCEPETGLERLAGAALFEVRGGTVTPPR